MFYFLEGDGASPCCHACLAVQEQGVIGRTSDPIEVISWHRVDAPTETVEFLPEAGGELRRAVESYLQDEFDRADVVLDRTSSDHPDLALARSLRIETQQLLFSGQMVEAIALLRDLRRVLAGLEQGRRRPSLAAPWDESVEELFDRVQARSTAMVRATPPPTTEDDAEAEAIVRIRDRRRASTSPS